MNQAEVRARFAATAEKVAALELRRRAALSERVRAFVAPCGDERAIDSAAGTGALALALAPLVREVVAVDLVPELLAEGRRSAAGFPNVTFVEGDATALPFPDSSFALGGTIRSLHHIGRPDRALTELVRVVRPGGRLLVADQIAPAEPGRAAEIDRFERARDPSHARLLADAELRALFEASGLLLERLETEDETRELAAYLDLAGCEGKRRARAEALAPAGGAYVATLAWYLLRKPPRRA